jgi:hypothetical protein
MRTAARAAAQPRQIALHIAVERIVAENLEFVLAGRVNVGEIDRLLVLRGGDGSGAGRDEMRWGEALGRSGNFRAIDKIDVKSNAHGEKFKTSQTAIGSNGQTRKTE